MASDVGGDFAVAHPADLGSCAERECGAVCAGQRTEIGGQTIPLAFSFGAWWLLPEEPLSIADPWRSTVAASALAA